MLNGEKQTIKNGFKKDYIVYKQIQPEFSAIHTKLCGDGVELEEALLYLLGNGYALDLVNGELELFNSTFLSDLCGSLGIYLEGYRYTNQQTYYEEVRRNSLINVAPPMIYVTYDAGTYLSLVRNVYENKQYEVIDPIAKELRIIGEEQVDYQQPWYMMNSPRFMRPVFRDMNEMIQCSIYKMMQTYRQLRLRNDQSYYNFDKNGIAEKLAETSNRKTKAYRDLFVKSLQYMEKMIGHSDWLEEGKQEILALWDTDVQQKSQSYETAVLICAAEEKIMQLITSMTEENRGYGR